MKISSTTKNNKNRVVYKIIKRKQIYVQYKRVELLNAFQGAVGFFLGTNVFFETLEDAYNRAKVSIE